MFDHKGYQVFCTDTTVFVYLGSSLKGSAGVQRKKDFDFDVLFRLALHKSGSEIES